MIYEDPDENRMTGNNNYQPYDESTMVKKTTSDDAGSIVLILGIIAIVSAFSFYLSIVGLVCGIISIVKGSSIRHYSSTGMAGFVLGIISVVMATILLLVSLAIFL
jgi:hypothetical protein